MKVGETLTLDTVQDADIIRWLAPFKLRRKGAEAMRDAIRAGWAAQRGGDLGGMERKLDRLLRLVESGVVVTPGEESPGEESAAVASALDKLGL